MDQGSLVPAGGAGRNGHQPSAVSGREITQLVLMVEKRRKQLVTQTESYRQIRAHSPRVLAIESMAIGVVMDDVRSYKDCLVYVAQEEVR